MYLSITNSFPRLLIYDLDHVLLFVIANCYLLPWEGVLVGQDQKQTTQGRSCKSWGKNPVCRGAAKEGGLWGSCIDHSISHSPNISPKLYISV